MRWRWGVKGVREEFEPYQVEMETVVGRGRAGVAEI